MKWDIKKLEEEYRRLAEKDSSTITPGEQIEKNNLADMINYHYENKKIPITTISAKIYDPSFFEDSKTQFGETISRLSFQLSNYQYARTTISIFLKGAKKTIEEFDEIIEQYFKTYDISLLELYQRYKDEKRIEIKPKMHDDIGALGKCYNFNYGENNYLSAFYNGTLKYSSSLVHELSHAKTCEKHANKVENQNYRLSVFCEALPKYYELCYADFLFENGNEKDALSIYEELLDNFIIVFEYKYVKLLNASKEPIHGDRGIMDFLSTLMAFKLYFVLHESPEYISHYLDTLESNIGVKSDYEIFKMFDLEDCKRCIDYVFKTYYNKKKIRKRKKTNCQIK